MKTLQTDKTYLNIYNNNIYFNVVLTSSKANQKEKLHKNILESEHKTSVFDKNGYFYNYALQF